MPLPSLASTVITVSPAKSAVISPLCPVTAATLLLLLLQTRSLFVASSGSTSQMRLKASPSFSDCGAFVIFIDFTRVMSLVTLTAAESAGANNGLEEVSTVSPTRRRGTTSLFPNFVAVSVREAPTLNTPFFVAEIMVLLSASCVKVTPGTSLELQFKTADGSLPGQVRKRGYACFPIK